MKNIASANQVTDKRVVIAISFK